MDRGSLRASDLRFLLAVLLPVLTLEAVALRPHTAAMGALAIWPEPFGPAHAWNAGHVLSNSLLANLSGIRTPHARVENLFRNCRRCRRRRSCPPAMPAASCWPRSRRCGSR